MTVSELYSHVAQLGFEDALENEDRFYFAANRALLQANTIRPATKALVINHTPLENLIKVPSFAPISITDEITFEAEGAKSFYFEADGEGKVYVEKYDELQKVWTTILERKFASRKKFVAYSGFIKNGDRYVDGRIRLRFTGEEFIYSVRNVALYKYLYSDDKADIPVFEAYTRYDMSQLTNDFIGFAEPPVLEGEENTYLNQGYEIESGRVLLLPYDMPGAYKVIYKRRPRNLENFGSAATDETVLDLDEELSHALPNLVAAYIWAEDEPSLAEYYLSLWRERAAEIKGSTKNTSPAVYKSCNGW